MKRNVQLHFSVIFNHHCCMVKSFLNIQSSISLCVSNKQNSTWFGQICKSVSLHYGYFHLLKTVVHSVSVFRLALSLSLCISLSLFLCQSPVFPLILKILLTQKALYLPGKFWCPGGFCSWHPPHSAGYVTGKKEKFEYTWQTCVCFNSLFHRLSSYFNPRLWRFQSGSKERKFPEWFLVDLHQQNSA